ncbi:hypothetical protein BH11ACT3_BH11ACT3_14080 [soil metagenome]
MNEAASVTEIVGGLVMLVGLAIAVIVLRPQRDRFAVPEPELGPGS